jgi:hypothetical protein
LETNIKRKSNKNAETKEIISLTNLLTLEKLPVVQPLKKFPAFYGTRRFITVFSRALHWSLS